MSEHRVGDRGRGVAIVRSALRAACLVIVVSGVSRRLRRSPGATTATSVAIVAGRATTLSGHPMSFRASVAPTKVGRTTITGTVTWSIVGHDGSTVACASTTPLSRSGHAQCRVGAAQLLGSGSPYAVTASYGGDANFSPSTERLSYVVDAAPAHLSYTIPERPTNGASTTIVVTVVGGPGTPALTGDVIFAAASGLSARGVKPFCAGTNPVPSANNSKPLVNGTATCVLPAGWMILPPAGTGMFKHPKTSWTISMTYGGTSSFISSSKSKFGHSNS